MGYKLCCQAFLEIVGMCERCETGHLEAMADMGFDKPSFFSDGFVW